MLSVAAPTRMAFDLFGLTGGLTPRFHARRASAAREGTAAAQARPASRATACLGAWHKHIYPLSELRFILRDCSRRELNAANARQHNQKSKLRSQSEESTLQKSPRTFGMRANPGPDCGYDMRLDTAAKASRFSVTTKPTIAGTGAGQPPPKATRSVARLAYWWPPNAQDKRAARSAPLSFILLVRRPAASVHERNPTTSKP